MLTRMVEWETRRRGFVIDDTYRYILAAGLEAEDANLFTRRHEVAIQQYLILLAAQRGDQETRATYLIELLYHILKTDGTNLLESVNRLNSYTQKGQIPTKHLLVSEESRLSFAAIQEVIPLPSQDVIQKVFGAKYNHDINVEIITLLNKLEPAATPFSWLNL